MHLMSRLPYLTAVLLVAATPFARAESPMPDPIAPAVIGRPLDQIRPARTARQKTMAAKPKRPQQLTASSKAAILGAPAAPATAVAVANPSAPAAQHVAKQALDDRADPNARWSSAVGEGTHFARKPSAPGAYFGSGAQALVRKYYAAHPGSAPASRWKIGEPVPAKAALTGVPDDVRAALPKLPPGHQYVQVDGEVVLVAVQSRMVVDGIARSR